MPLSLILGPPNSGRAGLLRRRFTAALDHDPVLVVPNADDVFAFEQELCLSGAALGGATMTFGGLSREVARACGSPPGAEMTMTQRRRVVSIAIQEQRGRLGPLRHSAAHPGFAHAFERLLDELQSAGLGPEAVEAGAGTLEGSAYLGDLAGLFARYEEVRGRLCLVDSHQVAREAISLLQRSGGQWRERPVFLYGFDDLTPSQLELLEGLARVADVTVALPHEEGSAALRARSALLVQLRDRIGVDAETRTEADPANTPSALLFHLERGFCRPSGQRRPPDGDLTLLRSAGTRGEAEAIGTEVAKLIAGGVEPDEIAIALRDPARRGPLIASVLESYGIATALEADLPVAGTAVGGGLIALLEAEFGSARARDLLRFLRGPSGVSPRRVDWFERSVLRGRVESAAAALELWDGEAPHDLTRVREAARRSGAALVEEIGHLAARLAARPLRGRGDGPSPGRGEGFELRAAAAISGALVDLGQMDGAEQSPTDLAATIASIEFRAWSGPVEGRVRIASPYRLRAGRFDHVFVGSLQDGEFPRHDSGGDPFLSEGQRAALGLEPRRDTEAEERYLFYVCLSLPRRRLFLSYRDSDEDGLAEPRSPMVDAVLRLLNPPASEGARNLEEAITRSRDLAQVVSPIVESPSEDALARAVAVQVQCADLDTLLNRAGVVGDLRQRIEDRLEIALTAAAAARAPGPLSNPAVIESLANIPAFGGTTLEEFDLCSYRWFAGHELDPQPLGPRPDPLVQGGLMHATLDRLYSERPGGDPLPRPGSLDAWVARGRELVVEIAAEREMGRRPAERAIARRVERLLDRFLEEESERDPGGFEPWLLEAGFGEGEDSQRPALEIDGWRLHGAIDRVDRDGEGRALVLDYKLATRVTPREKFEERAKLQLQLYLIAVAEQWGAAPIGGLYHPLRGTSTRRPRGVVLDEAAESLASYGLYSNDLLDAGGLEELLADARRRAAQIVARIGAGDIRRDPGPRMGLRGHDVCPTFCEFAPICRRDRAPRGEENSEGREL